MVFLFLPDLWHVSLNSAVTVMPAKSLAVTYTTVCEQSFSCAVRTVTAIWGRFSAENSTFHTKHRTMAWRTFAIDTEFEAVSGRGLRYSRRRPQNWRKSIYADELSESDNENSAPDDEESDRKSVV